MVMLIHVTNYKEYIKLAKKHGNIADWVKKKQDCDKAKIKYIHGVELYVCTELESDERGYHIGLYAKNIDGVRELNLLVSLATSKGKNEDKTDRHFYYNPRISLEELMNTSHNIIVTTACLASMLWKKRNDNDGYFQMYLEWLAKNNDRCFLEVQYHDCKDQKEYNALLWGWSKQCNIPLIAGSG